MAPVHNRMSIILHPGAFDRWLSREETHQPPNRSVDGCVFRTAHLRRLVDKQLLSKVRMVHGVILNKCFSKTLVCGNSGACLLGALGKTTEGKL